AERGRPGQVQGLHSARGRGGREGCDLKSGQRETATEEGITKGYQGLPGHCIMPSDLNLFGITFDQPFFLPLLFVPAALLILGLVMILRRRGASRRSIASRVVPVRERFAATGNFAFWMFLLLAASLCILALARPQVKTSLIRKTGADFVILQD